MLWILPPPRFLWRTEENDLLNEPRHEKTCLTPDANNTGADQPVHPRCLLSAFVVHYVDSIISVVVIPKSTRL